MNGPVTVVYVANSAKIGGGARVLMDLMLNLDPARFRPVVVAPARGALTEWAADNRVGHHVCADGDWQSSIGLVRRAVALTRVILRERAAIVHAAAPTCYRALGLAATATRTIRVCHLGFPPQPGELAHSFVAAPDAVIGCYMGQATDHADEIRGMRPDCRVVGICNGIDTDRFAPDMSDLLGLRAGASHVVAILGHISEVKGHPTFVDAAGLVARTYPGTRFLVVGGETLQTGMRERLEARAAALSIADRLVFLGFRNDVPDVLAAADVVVLPSRSEGFPLAVLEAMSCGKPVVATPVGGVTEAITDGVTGLLVPPDRPDSLAGTIAGLLGDEPRRRRIGANARRRIEAEFSVEVFGSAVQALYRQLLRRTGLGAAWPRERSCSEPS